jgi:hypothetical protein
LSAFLDRWLPIALGGEEAIVLAMCNPHRARVRRPAVAGDAALHYGAGDVDSWLDLPERRIRLAAPAWRLAE